jgi:hypothetical protein
LAQGKAFMLDDAAAGKSAETRHTPTPRAEMELYSLDTFEYEFPGSEI